jgi:hypothetical protein
VNLAEFAARARSVRAARGIMPADPAEAFNDGTVLGCALFLVREAVRHRQDIREIETDLAVLVERYPYLGSALVAAGPLEHVDLREEETMDAFETLLLTIAAEAMKANGPAGGAEGGGHPEGEAEAG